MVMGKRNFLLFVMFVLFLPVLLMAGTPDVPIMETKTSKPSKAEVIQKTHKLQIPFIVNKGQVDERVMFYANTFGGTVFITKDGEIVYSLPKSENSKDRGQKSEGVKHLSGVRSRECRGELHSPNGCVVQDIRCRLKSEPCIVHRILCTLYPDCIWNFLSEDNQGSSLSSIIDPKSKITGIALTEELVGARVKAVQGEQPSVTKVNYFKGNDPSKWKTNIATYDVVNIGEVYEGIELKLKAYGNNVEKLFCVKPRINPEKIKLRLSGTKDLKVTDAGELEVTTELGPVKFTKPVAYQEINGKRVKVEVEYCIQKAEVRSQKSDVRSQRQGARGKRLISSREKGMGRKWKNLTSNLRRSTFNSQLTYGFKVASYDKTKELVIDPLLVWCPVNN